MEDEELVTLSADDPEPEPEPEEAPARPDIDPYVVIGKLTDALDRLSQRGGNDELMAQLTAALVRLSDAQIQGAQLIASEQRRTHRPTNELVPNISVFNRRGVLLDHEREQGPFKQPLKCDMFVPYFAEWESCTREEVDLLNLLQQGEYLLTLNDDTVVPVTVLVDYKLDRVTPHRLRIRAQDAFNQEHKREVPPLAKFLRELLAQHKDPAIPIAAKLVMTDREEAAMIAAKQLTVSR